MRFLFIYCHAKIIFFLYNKSLIKVSELKFLFNSQFLIYINVITSKTLKKYKRLHDNKNLTKKGRLPEVTGLDHYLKLFRLSLDGQRARGHPGCSLYTYHVYTDGISGRLEFILLARGDLVHDQLP